MFKLKILLAVAAMTLLAVPGKACNDGVVLPFQQQAVFAQPAFAFQQAAFVRPSFAFAQPVFQSAVFAQPAFAVSPFLATPVFASPFVASPFLASPFIGVGRTRFINRGLFIR